MRKIKIAPQAQRDAAVISKVRKLRATYDRLRKVEYKLLYRLHNVNNEITRLQRICPHRRKKPILGNERWEVCTDCGKDL